jgi:hypothetical protein
MSSEVASEKNGEVSIGDLPKIVSVEKISLKPGDILFLEIEIGKMPPVKAMDYLRYHRDQIRQMIPSDIQIFISAMRDGKPATNVKVIRTEDVKCPHCEGPHLEEDCIAELN